MGDWANEAQDSVIVPTGATSGQRIILDGVTGKEDIYDSTGARVVRLDFSGLDVAGNDGSGAKLSVGSGAELALTPPPLQGVNWDHGGILANSYKAAGLLGTPYTLITAPNNHAQQFWASIYLTGASAVGQATQIQNAADAVLFIKQGGQDGVVIYPGAGGRVSVWKAGAEETWQPLAFAANGWSNLGGGYVTMQYRRVASPPNSLQLVGVMNVGTKASNTIIGNLPAGYRPLNKVRVPVSSNATISGGQSPAFDILPSGDITVAAGAGFPAGATDCEINDVIPLDA